MRSRLPLSLPCALALLAGCAYHLHEGPFRLKADDWKGGARVAIVAFDAADQLVRSDLIQQRARATPPLSGTPTVTPADVQQALDPAYWALAHWLTARGFTLVPGADVAVAEQRLPAPLVGEGMRALGKFACPGGTGLINIGTLPGTESITGPVAFALTPPLARRLADDLRADLVFGVHVTTPCDSGEDGRPWIFVEAYGRGEEPAFQADRSLWTFPIGPGFMPPPLGGLVRDNLEGLLAKASARLSGK